MNKWVDKLAKRSAKTPSAQKLGHQRVRRKKSPLQIELGSVRMEGQTTTIRVITDEWLPSPHRCYRYKYEVMDAESPYFQRVDQIHSDVMLSAGHTYVVRLNTDHLLHLLAAGLWAGGILVLATLRPPGGWKGPDGRGLLEGFSSVAIPAFLLTVATGTFAGSRS